MTNTSITDEFLKDRLDGNAVDLIRCGTWYSGFNRVFQYAKSSKIPFVGVWSNADACSFCRELEKVMMTDTFKSWMKTSKCVFWFGCSKDKSDEDKAYGTGFNWAWDNKTVKTYPFLRFYWTDGEKEVSKSGPGNAWRDGKKGDEGANAVISKLQELIQQTCQLKIRTNPEWTAEEVAEFREAIKANGGYCPCVAEQTDDSKCMCKWFREKTDEGLCHCELYQKYR